MFSIYCAMNIMDDNTQHLPVRDNLQLPSSRLIFLKESDKTKLNSEMCAVTS